MINCNTLCLYCDYPITFDTYNGCSHACKYCYVKDYKNIAYVSPINNIALLKDFCNGKRNNKTVWCDWNIPVRIGALSDPFQECEQEHRKTLEVLKYLAESKYPFIITTKNPVLACKEPYLSLLSQCNCVFQISMACGKYDKLEPGAPRYEKRLRAAHILSRHVTRLIVRVQPYFADCYKDILAEIPRYADSGAYGIICEGYTSIKKQKGLIKDGKYCFPLDILVPHFKKIKEECHKYGLRFFCGEDRIRFLGDDLSCCGTEGLDTFKPNKYNVQHLAHGNDAEPTPAMRVKGQADSFRDFKRKHDFREHLKQSTFEQLMHEIGDDYVYWYQQLRRKWGD